MNKKVEHIGNQYTSQENKKKTTTKNENACCT